MFLPQREMVIMCAMEVLANTMLVIMLQHMRIKSVCCTLKGTQCYMSTISPKGWENKNPFNSI